MWLAPLLLLAAATAILPLAELPPQVLPPKSCAMFLWDRASQRRIAMLTAEPGTLRIARDGVQTLPQTGGDGEPVLGFRPHAAYGSGPARIEVTLTITANDAGVGGAVIREGSLTVMLADGSALVTPVAGLIGCNP
ncbi:MAG: hypothetical protein CFE37_13430 [Alphaproteobacteria bacterium PA4]|nr:MAG: hypothetical protein CFE37_13430 [Alphaproteobacteria bacterium PA4]